MIRYYNLLYSFIIMLCLGSVWVFTDRLGKKLGPKKLILLSAIFFGMGYLIAGWSDGNFLLVFLGIGVLGGIWTGFGYLVSITNPAKWFPGKKGLVIGIAAAGFGLGAIILTWFIGILLESGNTVFRIFGIIGAAYGTIILILSFLVKDPLLLPNETSVLKKKIYTSSSFIKLVSGIFCGTFTGLLVIGNLKPIGEQFKIDNTTLLLGISLFSIANFTGRLLWGWFSDYVNGKFIISLALGFLGMALFLLGKIQLSPLAYLILSAAIGFGFGANFVLFAQETVQQFGTELMGVIYPYVFLGYGAAGIVGPVAGGFLFDHYNNYFYALYLASALAFCGALLFCLEFVLNKNLLSK